jgi:hypothetical protein
MASPPRTRGRTPPSTKKEKGSGSGSKTPQRSPSPSRSPARRSHTRDARRPQTRDARRSREVVVERIIWEGSSGNWPQLTKTNYHEWLLRMKLKMQARHLWDVVKYDDVEYDDDRNALDAICSGIPAEMVPILVAKRPQRRPQAWEAIKTFRIGDDRVQ